MRQRNAGSDAARGGMNLFTLPRTPANILLGLIILTCIILLIREIVCWYWKINDLHRELTAIRQVLERMEIQHKQENKVLHHESHLEKHSI